MTACVGAEAANAVNGTVVKRAIRTARFIDSWTSLDFGLDSKKQTPIEVIPCNRIVSSLRARALFATLSPP